VTALRRGWSLVELPGRRVALPDRVLPGLGIAPGSTVNPEVIEEAVRKHQPQAAANDAGRFLEKAEHTAAQLRDYLLRRGYEPGTADAVVTWASEYGYIDDVRYANLYVKSHTDRSPMGVRRMEAELRRRGVPGGTADRVLADMDDEDLFDTLVCEVRKKYGSLDRDTAWRRGAAWLARRGFDSSLAYRVMKEAAGE
jgi:regulatory protein